MNQNRSVFGVGEEDVFDEEGHRMTFKYTVHKPGGKQPEPLFCTLCIDEIDTVLGYFMCRECNHDYCKECAIDRNKMDAEIAENPLLIATPLVDLQSSYLNQKKQFHNSLIQSELKSGNLLQQQELQSNAGDILTDDLRFELELKELSLTLASYQVYEKELFSNAESELAF